MVGRPRSAGPQPSPKDAAIGEHIDRAVRSYRVREWLAGSKKVADRPLYSDLTDAGYRLVRDATLQERQVERTLAEEAIRGCALEMGLDLEEADRLADAAAPHLDRLVTP